MSETCRHCRTPVVAGSAVCPHCGASVAAVGATLPIGLHRVGAVFGGLAFGFAALFLWAALGFVLLFGSASVLSGHGAAINAIILIYNGAFIGLSVAAFNVGIGRAKRGEPGASTVMIPAILMLVPSSACAASVFFVPH